nr:hypothetical protein [Streptomyces shenzhenensis]
MISMHAKASIGRQWVRTVAGRPPCRIARGSRSSAPTAQRAKTTVDGDTSSTATLIIR